MKDKKQERKEKLAKAGRRAKWAPVWVGLKKVSKGNQRNAMQTSMKITRHKRNWRRTKLHIKPRKQRKSHLG